MGLGGPVWHASAAAQRPFIDPARLLAALYVLLDGYGAPEAGEWVEEGDRAWHLRRRLSQAEEALVGPVVDVRGTAEARRRVAAVWTQVNLAGPTAIAVAREEMSWPAPPRQ